MTSTATATRYGLRGAGVTITPILVVIAITTDEKAAEKTSASVAACTLGNLSYGLARASWRPGGQLGLGGLARASWG